ncbi:hypothetical protein O6H91_18G004600 [Diphasiastrum complanatum]|uniref:Uncharacterized protein n=1 Tax=Diphasiastrum complanatum TaxID=34168 RepID=A0ACC2AYL3_DIPCM|nr:hypothetical protein O6H91_18G004600 [Diphasiastrum complanatum]
MANEGNAVSSLLDFINRREGDPLIGTSLKQLSGDGGAPPLAQKSSFVALKSRPPCEYHNYKPLGLSLCFEGSKVQAVHVYNGTHGYSAYQGELPYGLRMQMRGIDIVKLLGEPDEKMGGGRGGPISIAYKGQGIQVNFVGHEWEDKHNIIDSLTIHEPT